MKRFRRMALSRVIPSGGLNASRSTTTVSRVGAQRFSPQRFKGWTWEVKIEGDRPSRIASKISMMNGFPLRRSSIEYVFIPLPSKQSRLSRGAPHLNSMLIGHPTGEALYVLHRHLSGHKVQVFATKRTLHVERHRLRTEQCEVTRISVAQVGIHDLENAYPLARRDAYVGWPLQLSDFPQLLCG